MTQKIENRNTLVVLLKRIRKASNFDEFSDFTFQLFDWLGAKAVFLKAEELNQKYFTTFFISKKSQLLNKRILIAEQKEYLKKIYSDSLDDNIKVYQLRTANERIQKVELDIFWDDKVDFKSLENELELLQPILTLKMEQLQLDLKVGKYEQMLANSMDVLMLIENKEMEYISPQAFRYLGYSREELERAVVSKNVFHPLDQKEIESKIVSDDKKKKTFSKREYRVKLKNGNFRWIQWVVRRIFDDKGDVLRMILNFRDITEKKEAEAEIENQKIFLQEILDRLPVEIYLKDLNGRYIFINRSAAVTLGLSPGEILGKTDLQILPRNRAERYVSEDKKVFGGEHLQQILETKKEGKKTIFLENKQLVNLDKNNVLLGYSVDITDEKENEIKLLESTEFINKSVQIIPDSIYIFDLPNFSYVFSNNKIFKKLGYKESDIDTDIRDFFNKIIHKEDNQKYFEQLENIKKGKKELYELEYRVIAKNGSIHWLFSKKTPMKRNSKGEIEQFVGLTFDITEQKKREVYLLKTREKLEKALNAREEFLSIISHEIRTPLNAILGIANLLEPSTPELERVEMLRVLKNSGENLLFMINDILDFSKIRADQMQFDISNFNLKELIQNICGIYKPQIKEKGLLFEYQFDNDISEILKGDPLRLNQILNNLMSNAIKFTDKGKVSCLTKLIKDGKSKQLIEIRIQDSGIGIPKSQQEIIFDPFQQVSSKTTRKYGGTGLGLSITKELIEKQGGVLNIDSEKGKGSEFKVIMPFEKSEGPKKNHSVIRNSLIPFKKGRFKILYVEDVSSNRYLMRAYCERLNLHLIEAKSGEDALKQFKTEKFSLILMDLQMPGMDGFETLKQLEKSFKMIPPVIALSADVSNKIANRIKDAGMVDYINKPMRIDILYQKIKNVLEPEFIFTPNENEQKLDKSKSVHQKLYAIYGNKKEYSRYIKQVIQEIEACEKELILALKEQNIERFREVSHKLIGPIGMFELDKLEENLNDLKFQITFSRDNFKISKNTKRIKKIVTESKNQIKEGLKKIKMS